MLIVLLALNFSADHLNLNFGDLRSNLEKLTRYRAVFTETIALCRSLSWTYVQRGQDHFSSDHHLCLLTAHQRRTVSFVTL
jgi:hypothetical protein